MANRPPYLPRPTREEIVAEAIADLKRKLAALSSEPHHG